MFSVYQHWDPLKVCVVGRSYPPEFYSWIKLPHVRSLFEKIAIETEEDYQNIIKKLQQFSVEVLRPELPTQTYLEGRYLPPPMTPRDYMVMIGSTFYENASFDLKSAYHNVKDSAWPDCSTMQEFHSLPQWIQDECNNTHNFLDYQQSVSCYKHIFEYIRQQNNEIKSHFYDSALLNGAQISRIGKDLYFGTTVNTNTQDINHHQQFLDNEFCSTRNHIVHTAGHSDSTYCPVTPGLIISLHDISSYSQTFPDWEIIYLPSQSWSAIPQFLKLKHKNRGAWWIPGFEEDQSVIDTVETWLSHWTGYVEETVFDVNMLVIDPKNVMVFNYNQQVFDALHRYGITPHVVPFRHRYFWDGGIHCCTTDLHREGTMQDFFPERT